MSEQPAISEELEQLRKAKAELTEKSKTRKARIEELEAANTALQQQVYAFTVGQPLQKMAESVSTAPELWIEQFNKSHRVELIDGKLTVVNQDNGKPTGIPFEAEALKKHLLSDKHPQAKAFNAITIVSRASGGSGSASAQRKAPVQPPQRFHLK